MFCRSTGVDKSQESRGAATGSQPQELDDFLQKKHFNHILI